MEDFRFFTKDKLTCVDIKGNIYVDLFEIGNGIRAFANLNTNSMESIFSENNGILLNHDDVFLHSESKREATKMEIKEAIKNSRVSQIPLEDSSAALMRSLCGLKAKRIPKNPKVKKGDDENEKASIADSYSSSEFSEKSASLSELEEEEDSEDVGDIEEEQEEISEEDEAVEK